MSSYMYLDLNSKEHPPISAHRGLMLGGAELCPLDWLFLPAARKPVKTTAELGGLVMLWHLCCGKASEHGKKSM